MFGVESEVAGRLLNRFQHYVLEFSIPKVNRIFIHVSREGFKEVVRFLANEGFTHLSAITALNAGDGLEILYHFSGNNIILTLRVTLPPNDYSVPTITDVIPGAILHEREAHDLFGIKFEGNPDLKPLILPEDWPADIHPMRKRRLE